MLLVAIVLVLSLQVFLLASLTHQTPTFVQPSGQQQLELTGRGRQMFSCVDDAWEAEGGGTYDFFVMATLRCACGAKLTGI
jgi:hypothetical protein